MSTGIKIDWEDCQPTIENIWRNIVNLDPLFKLDLMSMVINSYHKFYDYQKTHQDLENELRARDLNVGLIAVEWDKDDYYKKIVSEGKATIIKKNKFKNYLFEQDKQDKKVYEMGDIDSAHLSKYVTFISCRPRELVVKEILTHSVSIEENLKKLEIAGDLMSFNTNNNKIFDKDLDIKLDINTLNTSIQNGKKLLKLETIDFDEIFNKAVSKYPNAKLAVYSMLNNGSALNVLVDNGQIVCPIGINVYYEGEQQKIRYIPLS